MMKILREVEPGPGSKRRFECECVCGNRKVVYEYNLKSKTRPTRSCGCLRRVSRNKTHGRSHTAEWHAWVNMRTRCAKDPVYAGREVCERWQDFEAFYEDMGPRPSPEHSIDRIDNDKGYSPDNCRWTTIDVQARNKTTSRLLTFRGETKCITDWAREYGMHHPTLIKRLRRGMSMSEALGESA